MLQGAAADGRKPFIRWYSCQAESRLAKEIDSLAPCVGAWPKFIRVMDLKNRWTSCSKTGGLNLHWHIILLPIDMARYLVIHELVHLLEHSHSAKFYEILRRVAPEYENVEFWLKENGGLYSL